jgi:hypothetical protein
MVLLTNSKYNPLQLGTGSPQTGNQTLSVGTAQKIKRFVAGTSHQILPLYDWALLTKSKLSMSGNPTSNPESFQSGAAHQI